MKKTQFHVIDKNSFLNEYEYTIIHRLCHLSLFYLFFDFNLVNIRRNYNSEVTNQLKIVEVEKKNAHWQMIWYCVSKFCEKFATHYRWSK